MKKSKDLIDSIHIPQTQSSELKLSLQSYHTHIYKKGKFIFEKLEIYEKEGIFKEIKKKEEESPICRTKRMFFTRPYSLMA